MPKATSSKKIQPSESSSATDLRPCTCGCGKLVQRTTEWRHLKRKAKKLAAVATSAELENTTATALQNTWGAPKPPKGVQPASKRGGARSPSPKPRKKHKPTVVSQPEHTAPPLHDHALEDHGPHPAHDEAPLAGAAAQSETGSAAVPGSRSAGHDATAAPAHSTQQDSSDEQEHKDARPILDDYKRGRYRTTVEDADDDGDSVQGDGTDSGSDSEDDGLDVLDDFDEDEDGPSAWEMLGEELEQQMAALDALDGLSDDDMATLRAFAWAVENHSTRKTYQSLPRYFPELKLPSLSSSRTRMHFLAGIKPVMYDCCVNTCVLFVGRHADLRECPVCSSARHDERGHALKQFAYLPLIPRLKGLYRNAGASKRQRYRSGSAATYEKGAFRDYVDGKHYRELCGRTVRINGQSAKYKYFADARDVALGLFTDGFAPFKKRKDTCWPLLLVNYNLDPEIRYRQENLIELGVIPGPRQPTDLNSFLYPLVQELLELARGVTAFDGEEKCLFVLRAYLLLGGGDMPAVAKLMCMKGHNGLHSCRFCKIRGVRIPGARGVAHYTPLDRSTHPAAGSLPRYDPTALPLRTHDEMLRQAAEVENAHGAHAQRLGKESGFNGMPILAVLPSIRLDRSFPIEFMHLVWLNLIPNLVLLYTGNFKNLDAGLGLYELAEAVWEEIGRITAAAGATIPSAFGARVPNLAKDKSYMIAETWCIWTMHIAPVVLRGRFVDDKYYKHFLELVGLLRLCLQLEVTQDDVNSIRNGFARWVERYEEFFYQKDPARLATCVTTVHGLLHIADSIENMGPVGGYWSFVMERYCSSLRPAIKSRKNPYVNIANYLIDAALLRQVRLQYNLNASFRRRDDEAAISRVKAFEFAAPAYPASVLMPPCRMVELSAAERGKIARHLSVRFGANAKDLLQYVPERIEAWGKVRRLDDGDTVHARGLVDLRRGDRDASFIRYALEVDKFAHIRSRKPEFIRKEFFGQLQHVFVLPLPAMPRLKQKAPQTLLLASVTECKDISQPNRANIRYYSGGLKASEVIDLASVECVIGRVEDRGRWAILDRSNELSYVIIPEDDADRVAT